MSLYAKGHKERVKSEHVAEVRSDSTAGSFRPAGVYDVYSYRSLKWREVNTLGKYTSRLTSSNPYLCFDTVYPYAYSVISQLRPHLLRLQQRHLPPNSSIAFLDIRRKTWSRPS
jgi:hypothetical protein